MKSYRSTFACAVALISSISIGVTAVSNSFPTDIFPSISEKTTLSCKFGGSPVSGLANPVELSVSQAASAPTCFTSSSLTGSYMLVMICPDVAKPQALHYVQPDMISASNSTSNSTSTSNPTTDSSSVALSASRPAAVKYSGPAPSAGSGLHRYVMFMFSQPSGFKISDKVGSSDRTGFDIASFATEHRLGLPVAATFFVMGGSTGGNHTSGLSGNNGTLSGNSTKVGSSHNGTSVVDFFRGNSTNGTTILDSFRGNSTNGTLHGPFHGNGTSGGNSSTVSNGNRNGTSLFENSTVTSLHSSSSSSSSEDKPDGSSSTTGPVPISPSATGDSSTTGAGTNASTGGSSASFANSVLACFVAVVAVGVTCM